MPDIKGAQRQIVVADLNPVVGSGLGIPTRELSVNYNEEKRHRLREKLELLYQVKMPKKYKMSGSSSYGDSHSAHGLGGSHKPPLVIRK